MSNLNWKSFIFGSASILGKISHKITMLKNIVDVSKQNDEVNKVLFYGAYEDKEKQQVKLSNLFCIYYIIARASRSVDICVPTLNGDTMSKCLINVRKHERNYTTVRIIVHNADTLRNLHSLIACGIQVKIISPKIKLEHDFLLIDANCADAVAIMGSLDDEVNRVNHSKHSTLITSDVTLIETLKREFKRIWNMETCVQLDTNSNGDVIEKTEKNTNVPTQAQ